MKEFESTIDLMQENPEGFKHPLASKMKRMEALGICYEVDGWWYLQDDYLCP